METALVYKVIKTQEQYKKYCQRLEELVSQSEKSTAADEEIELLTLLIEDFDAKNTQLPEADPVDALKALMGANNLKAVELADILGVSKGLVSDILNYRKSMSKAVIRQLSAYFKVRQELFNRVYPLSK